MFSKREKEQIMSMLCSIYSRSTKDVCDQVACEYCKHSRLVEDEAGRLKTVCGLKMHRQCEEFEPRPIMYHGVELKQPEIPE